MSTDMEMRIQPVCQHCGGMHTTTCPRIAAIDYDASGQIKRIEFHKPVPTVQFRGSMINGVFVPGELDKKSGCNCHTCWSEWAEQKIPRPFPPFIVCSECGNKRCPKATNHEFACTGSNEPGQSGSIYGEV